MFLEIPKPNQFRTSLISGNLSKSDIKHITGDYQIMLLYILNTILRRYEQCPDYHFIDTKFSLITGKDFDENDPLRGKKTIYSWIQGRGLEALAGYSIWLKKCEKIDKKLCTQLLDRIHVVLSEVIEQMETLRYRNSGRLFFIMTSTGKFMRINEDGQTVPYESPPDPLFNYSDLFYVKGLAAAAHVLGLKDKLTEACQLFWQINQSIQENKFSSDQQQLDPKNTAANHIKGLYPHGPRMIGIGAVSCFLQCTKNLAFMEAGFDFLDYILKYHINIKGDKKNLKRYDMWEFVDKNRVPYVNKEGVLLSDPGHACEFVGLAFKLIHACETYSGLTDFQKNKIMKYKQVLPYILERNFTNGFSQKGLGICKSFDLISRSPVNWEMPWWSLPETIRAATSAFRVVPPEQNFSFGEIVTKCSNAFITHYIKPHLNLMAVQTLDKYGQPVDVIPATPDADPGYHTSLSIIDFLELYRF